MFENPKLKDPMLKNAANQKIMRIEHENKRFATVDEFKEYFKDCEPK